MATLDPMNPFLRYELTSDEIIAGTLLTMNQRLYLQSMLATYSIQRLSLDVDVSNVTRFIQQEAELKGKVQLLQDLINASDEVEKAILSQANQGN